MADQTPVTGDRDIREALHAAVEAGRRVVTLKLRLEQSDACAKAHRNPGGQEREFDGIAYVQTTYDVFEAFDETGDVVVALGFDGTCWSGTAGTAGEHYSDVIVSPSGVR